MLLHVLPLVSESFITNITPKRIVSSMFHHMPFQFPRIADSSSTDFAFESTSLFRMCEHVFFKVLFAFVLFSADRTPTLFQSSLPFQLLYCPKLGMMQLLVLVKLVLRRKFQWTQLALHPIRNCGFATFVVFFIFSTMQCHQSLPVTGMIPFLMNIQCGRILISYTTKSTF